MCVYIYIYTTIYTNTILEKKMVTHSSVLGWRIPRTGEPGGLLSMRSHRVGHDWGNLAAVAYIPHTHTHTHTHMHTGILLSHEKEWNNTVCSNMDGARDYHTKISKPDREK